MVIGWRLAAGCSTSTSHIAYREMPSSSLISMRDSRRRLSEKSVSGRRARRSSTAQLQAWVGHGEIRAEPDGALEEGHRGGKIISSHGVHSVVIGLKGFDQGRGGPFNRRRTSAPCGDDSTSFPRSFAALSTRREHLLLGLGLACAVVHRLRARTYWPQKATSEIGLLCYQTLSIATILEESNSAGSASQPLNPGQPASTIRQTR